MKVAVYGTLRAKGRGREVLIPGTIRDLGWYPGVTLDGNTSPGVLVEVVDINPSILPRLDQYEGYSESSPEHSLYIRRTLEIEGEPVFIYEYNGDISSRTPVPSGDWLEHTGEPTGANSHMMET